MGNSSKIILDLCGGSGAWSLPYREAGYDVRVISLPQYDVTHVVFTDSFGYMTFNSQCYGVYDMGINYADVYGILAAPPCTEFSVAKGSKPRDLAAGMEIVEACLRIIWHCRLHGALKFWALENPRGLLRQFMGVPHFTFQQWEFGEENYKPTDAWGYFNEPTKTVMEKPSLILRRNPRGTSNGRNWTNPVVPAEHQAYIDSIPGHAARRAAARAITPEGFARAFYRANR
jgi:hypothetical protein